MSGWPWQALLGEGRAWATQARWLTKDAGLVRRAGPGPTIVLLHGLYAAPGVFRPLREQLERRLGATTVSFGYLTGVGVSELAERLRAVVASERSPRPLYLVGHSLGGLVVRYYVQELAADARVTQTISLAAPFAGSASAGLVPGQAGRDIRPGSPLLEKLARPQGSFRAVPHLSVAADDDRLIQAPPFPSYGEQLIFPGVGHNGLLFDPRVVELLVSRIGLC